MLHYVDCWYDLLIVHEITVYGTIEFLNKDIYGVEMNMDNLFMLIHLLI